MPLFPRDGQSDLVPLHLALFSTELAVREMLIRLPGLPLLIDMPQDARSTALLVLAEVLNNVVKHALTDPAARIELMLHREPGGLRCCVLDRGLPMPGNLAPPGHAPALSANAYPPEGGYGWYMIRACTDHLTYERDGALAGGGNRLCFRVPCDWPD